jgi:hypothetical protein
MKLVVSQTIKQLLKRRALPGTSGLSTTVNLKCSSLAVSELINPSTQEPTGAVLIHNFTWEKSQPFIKHENAFKTSLSRVGRSTKQKIKTTSATKAHSELYATTIQGGIIRRVENGNEIDIEKSRAEMLEFARLYPESAAEAVEMWLESAKFKLLDENYGDDFNWVFTELPVKKVLWYIGDEENPIAAAILTFNSPPREKREQFEEDVQNIESEKKGDQNFAELSENFVRKVAFGLEYLKGVEGIAVGEEGKTYAASIAGLSGKSLNEAKETFVMLWNPIWFAGALETMLEAFSFTKGKSMTN